MNTINKKLTLLGLQILAILGVSLMALPTMAAAYAYGTNMYYSTGNGYFLDQPTTIQNNPQPSINSINPRESNVGVGTKTITIIGGGFIPSSIVRVNGASRYATFIDDSHLLFQITGNDTSAYRTNGGFYITVYNGAPGGGYSNTAFFKINNPTPAPAPATSNPNSTTTNFSDTTNNYGTYNNTNTYPNNYSNTKPQVQPDNWTDTNPNAPSNYSNLASNAIFGSNSFLPSGLIQWILLAIIILIIVILVRKIFGKEEKYLAAPLKHD